MLAEKKQTFSKFYNFENKLPIPLKYIQNLHIPAHSIKRILIDNTVSALMNLGYGRSDALKAVLDIYESCDNNGDVISENILIRTALQHIGKMKESL